MKMAQSISERPKTVQQRPPQVDYQRELLGRFAGVGHHMINLDAVGTGGEKRRPYLLAEGVAIVNISGVLVNNAWWWDETEYGDIKNEVRQALDDAAVKSILLRVNSPGGDSDGAFETAAFLEEAGKKKRIWSVADTMAYSAAYLLACHAGKIYVPPVSGGVGSIGVYALHLDFSGMLEQAGVKPTFITAGAGKAEGNRYQPLSKGAQGRIQEKVDRLYGEFVMQVSRGRKMPEEECRALGAYCYDGARNAIGAGLADASGLLEDAWMALAQMSDTGTYPTPLAAKAAETAEAPAEVRARNHEEVPMSKETAGADGTAKTYTQAEVDALVAAAKATASPPDPAQEMRDIVALCKDFGQPQLATGFIEKRTSRADVQKELARLRATSEETEIDAHVKPADNAKGSGSPAVTGAMLHAAVDKLVAQMKMKGGV